MAKICAVANQKGGVGKTTTTINLAACVAQAGKRVLLIDLDPQGNATSGVGVPKGQGEDIYDVLMGDTPLSDVVRDTEIETLKLVPSSMDLAGAEIELVNIPHREKKLAAAIAPYMDGYDYVFMDCPPSLGLITLNAFAAAHGLVVPIQCEYYALEGLTQLMNTVQLVRQSINPGMGIEGVVLTMFDGRTNLSNQVAAEVRKYFRDKVYQTPIPRNVRLSEAPSFGQPIHLYDPTCAGAQAYGALAREFLEKNEGGKA